MTIAEIRKKLKEEYDVADDQLTGSKSILRAKLELLKNEGSVFDDAEMEEEEVIMKENVTEEVPPPSIDSPEWSDYVLSHFESDEMMDGSPTCDGLRRVTELLVGPITERRNNVIQAPGRENYGTSTVACTVSVLNNIQGHLLFQQIIREEDAADVNKYNTQEPYHMHATATATTRAEARALRKILRLRKVIAAEELADDKIINDYGDIWKPDDQIDEEQISLLDIVCQRCNINLIEYVNSGEVTYKSIQEVNKNKASEMVQHLNNIQQGKSEKPVGVGEYDSNWRDE